MVHRILVTNDDGVNASGLRAACQAMVEVGEVTVVAPSFQRSAVGRSISLYRPIRVCRANVDGFRAFAVDGSPTDAVIIGLYAVLDHWPDLVVSGFNLGENLSSDTVTTSGTIGATLEAASQGVPAMSVSIQMPDGADFYADDVVQDYTCAATVTQRIARRLLEGAMPEGVDVLNVNIPYRCAADTPIVFTRLARRVYQPGVEERHDPRGRPYYWISGSILREAPPGTDVHATLMEGKISITPISLDATAQVEFDELRDLFRARTSTPP